MAAYVVFDVEVWDFDKFAEFQQGMTVALEAVGARYLARAGKHFVYEGDWEPRRLTILEFPSLKVWDDFYKSNEYTHLRHVREECSSARLVAVQGV